MSNPEREAREDPKQWPPCDRAQADGVPCQDLGRDCEKCEEAYPKLEMRATPPAHRKPEKPGSGR